MRAQPELLVTAGSVKELERLLLAGADAILMGESKYSVRMPGEMTLANIEASMEMTQRYRAKLYIAVNAMLHNEHVTALPVYLQQLEALGIDAIVYGDPAVLMVATTVAPTLRLQWNAEMTSTNYRTAQYWNKRGASRIVASRELNLEQVVEMKQQLPHMEVQVQIHGMTNIYHSKRHLVRHYMHHRGKAEGTYRVGMEQKLFLVERERQNEKFPLFEDTNGTHIMSSDDICFIEDLKSLLDARIDSLKIEGILKSISYNETIVRVYREAIDAYMADPAHYTVADEWLRRIRAVQDPERELSSGFFYKEQIY